MARLKTFDSTGIAPNGRLYAGDLNAIQDFLAKASDFTQTVDVGTLRVGDSSIQLLKFGTAEARVTAALRTDGVIRGLGGITPGSFTTVARDAIALGSRPTGMTIFNTTTNRAEMNVGTDATPNWQPVLLTLDVTQLPLGGMIEYAGSADFSASVILCDGRPISRTTYSALFALLGTSFGGGDGSTTFNIPDVRGRGSVGPDNMGTAQGAAGRLTTSNKARGQSGGEEFHVISTGEMPSHFHGGGTQTAGSHSHLSRTGRGIMTNASSGDIASWQWGSSVNVAYSDNSTDTHAGHQHGILPEGGGAGHNTLAPYQVINKLIRII